MKTLTPILIVVASVFNMNAFAATPKNKTNTFKVPFKLVKKLIVVEAKVDGQAGWFILDTGLPDVLLNKNYFDDSGRQSEFTDLKGVAVPCSKIIVSFELGAAKSPNRDLTALDLSYLEQKTKIPIKGLIGYQFLKKFEIVFDYPNRMLTFYKLNRKGKKIATKEQHSSLPLATLPLKLKGHLMVATLHWANQNFKFGLDSGAGVNLIDTQHQRFLETPNDKSVSVKLVNLGQKSSKKVSRKLMQEVKIGNGLLREMKTIPCDFKAINLHLAGKNIDGILGYEFFSQLRVAINFKQKKLYLLENTRKRAPILALNEKE